MGSPDSSLASNAIQADGDRHRGDLDLCACLPTDVLTANTTLAAEPRRRFLVPGRNRIDQTFPATTAVPAMDIENPRMIHADQCLSRSNIAIPTELAPIIKNRISQSAPDQSKGIPFDEWAETTLQGDLVYLSETGPNNDG